MQNIFKLNDKNISYALNMLLGWLFSLSLMSGIIFLTILDTSFTQMAFMTFCGVLIAAVVLYNRYTMALSFAVAVIFAIAVYRSLSSNEPLPFFMAHAEAIYETWRFVTGEISFTLVLNRWALWMLAFSISALSAFLLRLKFSYTLIFAIGVGVFMSVNLASPGGMHGSFFLLLMALLLIFIKRSKNSPSKVLVLAPLCAVVIALANMVPMPDFSAGRRLLETLYEDAYWVIREPFMPRYFSSQWLGFENRDGLLGGNLSPNGDFIMWVFADEPTYLAGATQNIYTGSSWVSSDDEYDFEQREEPDFTGMRNFEIERRTHNGVFVFDDEFGYYTRQSAVSVNIGRARTGTIFRPPNSMELNIYGDYEVLQRGVDLRVAPVFRRNAAYSFINYTIDQEDEHIQHILLKSRRGFYEERRDELRYAFSTIEDNVFTRYVMPENITSRIIEDIRLPYAKFARENYTALPNSLPQRVVEHTLAIVEGYESDYEKATAIMNYLRTMPYSLTPGHLPEDRDFVDYFLFDVREGYCTYFASAMAVMARVIGLPSRYNVGFITPNEQVSEGLYAVYGVNAHAWAEIYFEGLGWIIFEATPPSFWNQPFEDIILSDRDGGDGWWEEEYLEMEWFFHLTDSDQSAGGTFTGIGAMDENHGREVSPALIVSLSFALALGSYMFIRKAEENRRHTIINGSLYQAAVLEGFKGLIGLMTFYGLPMKASETAIGYAKRIEKLTPLASTQLKTAAEIFGRARYSKIEITAADAEFVKKNYFLMYKKMKDSNERYRFFIHRYIKKLR